MKYLTTTNFILCALLLSFSATAQGIRGTISAEGEPLPFATIYIEELGTGTSSNAEGYYEYRLKPGSYTLTFRYLGYGMVIKTVEVGNDFTTLDVALTPNIIELKEIEVSARREDPAYTVIRKAIAKSKYHILQLDSYTAKVYIKGGGRIKKIPFYLKKTMKKEGIDTSTVYLTESISKLKYTRPNTYEEEVISIRQVGDDNSTTPNSIIQGSFYYSDIGGVVSPLSPKAFAYYKFKYMGSFFDGEHEINKIQVTPRVRGENVFTGEIYIVEDWWSIHSVDLYTYKLGFKIDIKQIYTPVEEGVWMPISHDFNIDGSVLGVGLTYDYFATLSDYQVTLNPDLEAEELVVIDEKLEKEEAKAIQENTGNLLSEEEAKEIFDDKKTFTRKELRKTLKKYEKEMIEAAEEWDENDTSYYQYPQMKIDSTAYTKDSAYWAEVRPIPLSTREKQSYQKLDSTALAEKEKAQSDTVKREHSKSGADLSPLLTGKSFKLGKHANLKYTSPLMLIQFNTVEGYYSELPIELTIQKPKSPKQFVAGLRFRYGEASERFYGKGGIEYKYKRKKEDGFFRVEGGRYVHQFAQPNAIAPIINTLWSLLGERNYLKLFERDYVRATLSHRLSKGLRIEPSIEWAQRRQLFNQSNRKFIDVDERTYTPNAPFNRELADTGFPEHTALTAGIQVEYLPIIKYRMVRGKKRAYTDRSPILRFQYNKGIPDLAGSEVDFDHLELGVQHQFRIGAMGRLDFNLYGGTFTNSEQLYFMDYQHFPGNRTFLQTSDPVRSFRLLDYYEFSTTDDYLAGHLYYQFRKLLLTQIFELRLMGLKESLVLNYLHTDASQNYTEVGYSLDNIFRFFRVEAVASFEDFKYQGWGIRIGVSTNLSEWLTVE